MDYPARGWPIAPDVIEDAYRRFVKYRSELFGMRRASKERQAYCICERWRETMTGTPATSSEYVRVTCPNTTPLSQAWKTHLRQLLLAQHRLLHLLSTWTTSKPTINCHLLFRDASTQITHPNHLFPFCRGRGGQLAAWGASGHTRRQNQLLMGSYARNGDTACVPCFTFPPEPFP